MEAARLPLGKIVEKEIDRSNATVAGDDEIGAGVSGWLTGSARYPANPSGIAYFLGRGKRLIFKIWMRCFYRASNTMNFVATAKDAAFWVIENCVFVEELVDGS